jgi:endonuclease/exonuclease/phosphatase family metal-dependent hydrolase
MIRKAQCLALLVVITSGSCSDDDGDGNDNTLRFTVVTFNTGTSESMGHDSGPDDGYTSQHAAYSDEWYGDGLAWLPAVEATRAFFSEVSPDIVVFQEVFYTGDCTPIPPEARQDFICETWQEGDPTVAQQVLGAGYQVMCHPGHNDKCAAVKTAFGSFRGCESDFCLEGMEGYRVEDCGRGARVGRGVIELATGGELTLVNFHGSSGVTVEEQQCRVQQIQQVFVDLGDGDPAANGERNLIMGDFNTDPYWLGPSDESAALWAVYTGEGTPFHFISEYGPDAPGSYAELLNIDHVVSDVATGSCWIAGLTEGHPKVIDAIYFDHKPVVCALEMERPR